MKLNKIILAGGSGYMGTVIAEYFREKANDIVILSRQVLPSHHNVRYVQWDARSRNGNLSAETIASGSKADWTKEIDGADLLVNLTGKSVNCRYTEANRKEIFRSRLESTEILGKVIGESPHPPELWINMASATIYRHAEDRAMDETTGEIGEGFSIEVCKAWEKTFFDCRTPSTRKVCLRVGIVMGRNDGAYPLMRNMAKVGLGGKQGNGKQQFTWVHELDMARIVEWIAENKKANGVYNCTSPGPIPNKEVMRLIRKTLRVPIGLPSPAWLLKMGAVVIGTETELILKSRWVIPKRLTDEGFKFQFPEMENALRQIENK
ncbi:MAG TPA: TIGR01777 family oxidoreductase [Bacteroidia bacterium]|nr:TIGR01777 family oxidoreductase [Bacteroidia bacterium]